MKKIVFFTITVLLAKSTQAIPQTLNTVSKAISAAHIAFFEHQPIFAAPFTESKASQWSLITDSMTRYVKNNDTNIFGTPDPILEEALETTLKANKSLMDGLQTRDPALLNEIDKQMTSLIEGLQNSSFILKSKKNARTLLVHFATIVRTIAQKAHKELEMKNQ